MPTTRNVEGERVASDERASERRRALGAAVHARRFVGRGDPHTHTRTHTQHFPKRRRRGMARCVLCFDASRSSRANTSNVSTPSAHQSAERPWPELCTISGARYFDAVDHRHRRHHHHRAVDGASNPPVPSSERRARQRRSSADGREHARSGRTRRRRLVSPGRHRPPSTPARARRARRACARGDDPRPTTTSVSDQVSRETRPTSGVPQSVHVRSSTTLANPKSVIWASPEEKSSRAAPPSSCRAGERAHRHRPRTPPPRAHPPTPRRGRPEPAARVVE